jgi:hypothetical protein
VLSEFGRQREARPAGFVCERPVSGSGESGTKLITVRIDAPVFVRRSRLRIAPIGPRVQRGRKRLPGPVVGSDLSGYRGQIGDPPIVEIEQSVVRRQTGIEKAARQREHDGHAAESRPERPINASFGCQ